MKLRSIVVVGTVLGLLSGAAAGRGAIRTGSERLAAHRAEAGRVKLPKGFVPAVARSATGRYIVVLRGPSVAGRTLSARGLSSAAQRADGDRILASQEAAIHETTRLGGRIQYRYHLLVDGFSAIMSRHAAEELATRSDVASVQPAGLYSPTNETSVPFIGAPQVWHRFGARGQGIRVAVIDTGTDYTHVDFGGPGTASAYQNNNPTYIEPGTFPTKKVIGGWDFVGENFDPLSDNPALHVPQPDPDPLDQEGHGTHTAGTVLGEGAKGVAPGVAPQAKLYSYKVFAQGSTPGDIIVAALERSADPNQDGSTRDRVDVVSMSLGEDYGTELAADSIASERLTELGTIVVAAAGNAGNQPAGGSAYVLGDPAAAPDVIAAAASIDVFKAQTITVNSPNGVTLPDKGLMVQQSWGADLPSGGLTHDLFDARAVQAPADPSGQPAATDQMLCNPLPGNSLAGKLVLVYKAATGAGDCSGSTKVFNAQNAGATGVVLWSGFGGVPFGLASNGENVTIPAVMISGNDAQAIADALSPPGTPPSYNANTVNVTLNTQLSSIPGYPDAMTDFSSEGPARITNDLKPDIAAPGFDVDSAAMGTGDGTVELSGTSMATPHIAGVAALLRELHPAWNVRQIKALMMNHATRDMKNNDLSKPVPAAVMGAGRVQAYRSATATSVAWPGSMSFQLQTLAAPTTSRRAFWVGNYDSVPHDYTMSGGVRFSDFYDPSIAQVSVSDDGSHFAHSVSFSLAPGQKRRVYVHLRVDPSTISGPLEELGLFYYAATVDGTVTVQQTGSGADTMRLPWGVVPLAASRDSLSTDSLDLTSGSKQLSVDAPAAAGTSWADLYLLGATDPVESHGEEDITSIGARSFTGPAVDGTAAGVPTGQDPLVGVDWRTFLTNGDTPTEPVEFGVRMQGIHQTTEPIEVDVLIDKRADGVFPNNPIAQSIGADYILSKLPQPGGPVCLFDLSQADPFDQCAASYFPDYSNYNSSVFGLPVDASAIGLTTGHPTLSYAVEACTGFVPGDVTVLTCDDAGDFDGTTYTATLNAVDPALDISTQVCGGFWGTTQCDASSPVTVDVGSAGAGDDPSILALFPNNRPSKSEAVVTTQT